MRRQLYAPGGASSAELDAYEQVRSESVSSGTDADSAAPGSASDRRDGHHRGRRLLPGMVAMMIGGALLGAGVTARPTPPIDPPALPGRSIAAYGRGADPHVGLTQVTYQPEGYTVFQAQGRVVHVALRCIGSGTVTIAAGSVNRFVCTDRDTRFERSDGRHRRAPFMVTGRTTGDVVWGVRVTLRDR